MLLVVIKNDANVSLKTAYVIEQFKLKHGPNLKIFYVLKGRQNLFAERLEKDKIYLPSSVLGILLYYCCLFFLKSPRDYIHSVNTRILKKQRKILIDEGLISVISRVFIQFFVAPARSERVFDWLDSVDEKKVFLIDEFVSFNMLKLDQLKVKGKIVYVSQDLANKQFGFFEHYITKKLMYQFDLRAVSNFDSIIACSERDAFEFKNLGAKKIAFYPNIYPIQDFEEALKDADPSICIVLRNYWGNKATQSLKQILAAISIIDKRFNIYLIGIKPSYVPKNVKLFHCDYFPNKKNFMEILSKAWIGINVGSHFGGTNERKYDYALAGLVVLSDMQGARGDLIPFEYTYVDDCDLSAKLNQLLAYGKEYLVEKGKQNQAAALDLAKKQSRLLFEFID